MPEMDTDLQKLATIIASAPTASMVIPEAASSPVNTGGNFDPSASYQPQQFSADPAFTPSGPGMNL